MAMSLEELMALYLVQHPEEEAFFFDDDVVLDNGQRASGVVTVDAALRYSQWCYDNGYIDRAAYDRSMRLWGPGQ
jgi:hypothetical protein